MKSENPEFNGKTIFELYFMAFLLVDIIPEYGSRILYYPLNNCESTYYRFPARQDGGSFQKFREVLSQAEDKNHESRINKEKNNRLIPFDSPTCSNK